MVCQMNHAAKCEVVLTAKVSIACADDYPAGALANPTPATFPAWLTTL